MDCSRCETETVLFAAGEYAATLPGETPTVGLCPRCLKLDPGDGLDRPEWAAPPFERISPRFPTGEAAVPFALLAGLIENLALYRMEITELLEATERAGVDPLSALGRLDREPTVEPETDLSRRREQLEQLL
ncbi:hypothetical protein BRC62_07080 [Halobacteriales archaeon QH_10_67_13]|nr:MAG: hypothetical protein BRC62_07080 [Halobacteriales archaeon QH_10_67_13]